MPCTISERQGTNPIKHLLYLESVTKSLSQRYKFLSVTQFCSNFLMMAEFFSDRSQRWKECFATFREKKNISKKPPRSYSGRRQRRWRRWRRWWRRRRQQRRWRRRLRRLWGFFREKKYWMDPVWHQDFGSRRHFVESFFCSHHNFAYTHKQG